MLCFKSCIKSVLTSKCYLEVPGYGSCPLQDVRTKGYLREVPTCGSFPLMGGAHFWRYPVIGGVQIWEVPTSLMGVVDFWRCSPTLGGAHSWALPTFGKCPLVVGVY